ncbi:MAG TPA: hypothetical protein VKD91_13115 [Pyrinomonadaceae bacterium]|nr:hypothetical protein [Pyrinomonadaceae bacterium]
MRIVFCLLLLASPLAAQVAPDATLLSGGPITVSEYKLPAGPDPVVSAALFTELWARVYRPASLGSSAHALLVFLHGNHATCGRLAGPAEHFDINVQYTFTGTCPAGFIPVPSHAGYGYLAERLAGLGYIVVSINANRGINAAPGVLGDRGLNLARGRLVLRHLQKLSRWNSGAETPPAGLSDLVGRIDFTHVGLLGHSRGGEGMRAAYNLYQTDSTNWVSLIGPMTVEGIFEIGPVDGQTALTLNALGTAWNVLLPMCDGDVFNLQGVRPFDRMLRVSSESPARQKSTFAVWGANHNFYNTEWQVSDSAGCFANQRLFDHLDGSADERTTAIASAVAFFVANVGATKLPDYNRIFNPQFGLPASVTNVTRVDRGYTDSPDSSLTAIFDDFTGPTGSNSHGPANDSSNVSVFHGHVADHDRLQQFAALVSWNGPGANTFLQDNWTSPGTGVDASSFGTIDFRVSRQCADPADLLCNKTSNWFNFETNFSVRLVDKNGVLSNPVQLSDYLSLTGPVGSLVIGFGTAGHPILQTARIPLTAFGNAAIVSNLRGVRFTFDDTRRDEIYIANIQLSKLNGLLAPLPAISTLPTADTSITTTNVNGNDVNRVKSMRSVQSATLGDTVEIELSSNREFLPQGEMLVLRIGSEEFNLSRYPDTGETSTVVFTLTAQEFAGISQGDSVGVQYGSGPNYNGWNFGKVDKTMLGR